MPLRYRPRTGALAVDRKELAAAAFQTGRSDQKGTQRGIWLRGR